MRCRGAVRFTAIVLLGGLAAGCTGSTTREVSVAPSLVIGSYAFIESRILASIYGEVLKSRGYPVTQVRNVAAREILDPALEQGKVDLVPEYQGATLRFFRRSGSLHPSSAEQTHRLLARALTPRGLRALSFSPGQDRNEFVVTRETARRYHLETISDLAPVADRLSFGGPPECLSRPFCLKGLRREYGIRFKSFVPLDAGGPLSLAALTGNEVNVALLFTTDPSIKTNHLVVLKDDKHLQPTDNVVPVIRRQAIARFGHRLVKVINRVTRLLGKRTLRELNRSVSMTGIEPRQAALSWLEAEGFLS